jgi:hypothetical protein
MNCDVPERFNFARDAVKRLAAERDRRACSLSTARDAGAS